MYKSNYTPSSPHNNRYQNYSYYQHYNDGQNGMSPSSGLSGKIYILVFKETCRIEYLYVSVNAECTFDALV